MMRTKTLPALLLIFAISMSFSCSYISSAIKYEDPLTAEEHNNLGVAYEKEGKYKLAMKEFKKAAKKDPALVTPVINLGNVYFVQGKFKKAEKYYLKALAKDSKSIVAANNLGNVYLKTGKNYEKGIDQLTFALPPPEIAPAYALDTLAMLYARSGDTEMAMQLLQSACSKTEGDDSLKSEIDTHLKEIGNKSCEYNQE